MKNVTSVNEVVRGESVFGRWIAKGAGYNNTKIRHRNVRKQINNKLDDVWHKMAAG